MMRDVRLVVGYSLLGVMLPIFCAAMVVSMSRQPFWQGSGLLLAGLAMAIVGRHYNRRARREWGLSFLTIARVGPKTNLVEACFRGQFLAVTAFLAVVGVAPAVVGVLGALELVAFQPIDQAYDS